MSRLVVTLTRKGSSRYGLSSVGREFRMEQPNVNYSDIEVSYVIIFSC
jgi:hypothetical protein